MSYSVSAFRVILSNNWTWLLAAAFVASSAFFLVVHKSKRDTVLDRLRLSRRRVSGAKTPPRSLSPSKKQVQGLEEPNYLDTLPPSRHHTLATLVRHGVLEGADEQSADRSQNMLPMKTCFLEADESMCTPSLIKMESDWWLEIENSYAERIRERQALLAKHGDAVLQALPGSELACKELMEMALQFLCARYPHYFQLDKDKMIFHNNILETQTNLKTTEPLHVLFNNIPEDFAIMLRDDETGFYLFRAGIICSSLGWNVASKIGMRLHEIHAPIPDYKEKMQFSMDRYFAKKPTDKAIQRGSWGLEVDQPLYMPPGDPHEKHREYQMGDLDLSRCNLRVDWQTLRRLPLSAGVVFNFKALFTPVEEFRDEPYIPGLLLKVLNEGKKSLMEYKNTWHVEHVVKPALERFHKEQVEKGLVPEDWAPHTLEESPWYPGWEEKWHRQQGF
ncbi:hypothetical protein EK21DRAFT_71608 [Setomelanomma holmii]|uniref:Uncharacterized protein n=1 Tax=Setomelanomma holmii TaxID=210430 RepID=A0A9P4LKG9_9PLEO|nr:hypothetical protein EK21DRAFT_71608 [Setomelanomma holmii]